MQIHSGPHNISSFKQGIWWKIVISCLFLIGIGGINTLWVHDSDYQPWFDALVKPHFINPEPRWIVGAIWAAMYILMGGSVGIIWQVIAKSRYAIKTKYAQRGIILFFIQLLVNMSVPVFFFALNNLWLNLIGVIVNLFLVGMMIRHFFRLDRLSAYLLVPFFIWILYAVILAARYIMLN